jgi:hypothetical protein
MAITYEHFIPQPQSFDDVYIKRLFSDEIYVEKLSALSADFINIVLELLKLSSLDLFSLSTVYLTAGHGLIYDLDAPQLSSVDAFIYDLSATYINVESLTATDIFTVNLTAKNFVTDFFRTGRIDIPTLSAQRGFIDELSAKKIITEELTSTNAFINNLTAIRLSVKELDTDFLDTPELRIPRLSANEIFTNNLTAIRGISDVFDTKITILSSGIDLFTVIDRPQANVLYVSVSGNDNDIGRLPARPLRTIKRACQIAHNDRITKDPKARYTIFVQTGDYTEDNPIYVPTNVSIIGDNLRRTTIKPLNRFDDVFWVDNSAYIWGVTFRDHYAPCACVAFPDLTNPTLSARAFNNKRWPMLLPSTGWRRPFITTSPYAQGSSSITEGLSSKTQSVVSQYFDPTKTQGELAIDYMNKCFDTVTEIITYGELSGNLAFNTGVPAGAVDAVDLLLNNTQFILSSTIGFLSLPSTFGQPNTSSITYDVDKCRRDLDLILSAVRTDITTGNNDESIMNGQAYYYGANGNISYLPPNQIAPTVQAIQYAKHISKYIVQNQEPPIIEAGCGMRVDGSKAEGFLRSMVLDSFTQFNQNGKGIHILNNGYAQLVSIFTICTTEGMLCESGGLCSISNSNCSFGLSGIVAKGKSPTPVLSGAIGSPSFLLFGEETPGTTQTILVSGVQGLQIFPDSNYYPQFFNQTGIDTRQIAYTPYNGLVFTIQGDLSNNIYTINNNPVLSSINGVDMFVIDVQEKLNTSLLTPNTKLDFYIRSAAYASSHTFEFVGSGVYLNKAVPALGGVAKPEDEVAFDDIGFVFYTSTNHTGDFSVGEDFRIVQSTGTIEGDTFKRAILTLVTPLTLSLE